MYRTLLILILLAAIFWNGLASQTTGDHRGIFVGMYTTTPGTNFMLQLDAQNTPSSFRTRPGTGPWPFWGNPFGMTLDADNHHVIVPGLVNPGGGQFALVRWDPGSRQVVGTLWTGPLSGGPVVNWSNWTLNSDGNPVTIDNADSVQKLVEFDRFSGAWISYPLPAGTGAFAGLGGLEWDPVDGEYVHAAWGSAGIMPSSLYRTRFDGSQTRTLASATGNVTRFGGTLLENGDWIAPASSAYQYYTVKAHSTLWSPGPPASTGTLCEATHEKYAAPGQGFYAAVWDAPRGIVHIDPVANTYTVLHTGTASTMPTTATEVTPLYERDLSTVRTGKGTWDVHINPGQGAFSGKGFRIFASLVAPRSPIALADGREVYIGMDPLFLVSLFGSLPPYFTGNIGTLGATGQGKAILDFQTAGTVLNGMVIHLCGVVLDSRAPAGIGWVCDPHAFVINVRI